MAETSGSFWGDAYKGDGMMGLGSFLEGIARAYRILDQETQEAIGHLTENQRGFLQQLLQTSMQRYLSDEFSKATASSDITESYSSIFRDYRESELPVIFSKMCSNGYYNSTTSQLLANDAYARAVDKAGQAKHGAIKDYAEIQVNQANPAVQGLNVALNDLTDRKLTFHEETKPDMGQFGEDAAVMFTIMGVLSIFSKRRYLADQKGSSTATDPVTGVISSIFDWAF